MNKKLIIVKRNQSAFRNKIEILAYYQFCSKSKIEISLSEIKIQKLISIFNFVFRIQN